MLACLRPPLLLYSMISVVRTVTVGVVMHSLFAVYLYIYIMLGEGWRSTEVMAVPPDGSVAGEMAQIGSCCGRRGAGEPDVLTAVQSMLYNYRNAFTTQSRSVHMYYSYMYIQEIDN